MEHSDSTSVTKAADLSEVVTVYTNIHGLCYIDVTVIENVVIVV